MNAKAIAQVMRTRIGAPGQAIMMTRRPSPAHSLVPVVEGSAKRFWVTSCMTRPLIDMAAPERMRAIVRGTRTARNKRQPSSWDRIEYSPVARDRSSRAMTASVARPSARGRRDEAWAASRVAAASAQGADVAAAVGADVAGVETVGECVIGTGAWVPPRGAAPTGVPGGYFFAASKASAMELKISV